MSQIKINKVVSIANLTESIDLLVKKHKLSYIDAIVAYCEQNSIEVETAAALIKSSSRLKSKVEAEGLDLRLIIKKS